MVLILLFAVPASMGLLCGAICLLLRRFVLRRAAMSSLAVFLVAVGAGMGVASMAMHWHGYRLSALKPIYDLSQREFVHVITGRSEKQRFSDPQENRTLQETNGG